MKLKKVKMFFSRLQIKIYNKLLSRNMYMQKYYKIYKNLGITFGDKLPRYIDPSVELDGSADVYIGEHTTIAAGTVVLSHDYSIDYAIKGLSNAGKAFAAEYKVLEKVSIGKAVFIGQRAIILPGVTIGDFSIIGAGSLVNTDIPPREVWGGGASPVYM